jgi:Ca-activated chloride channel family protein
VIAPLALLGLLILPIIVAFYMLRLRRRDVPVGSTFLWAQLVRDVEANAPWQRLRFSWLLVVQLLLALLLVIAAARPFVATDAELAANVVLVVDTSASMGAEDDGVPRIEHARRAARGVVDRLPVGGRVTVVAAADSAEVVAAETDDRDAARAAIDGIEATQLPGDMTDAFALASALAARHPDSDVVLVTDANAAQIPGVGVGAPVRVELVGSSDANQAVAALSTRARAGGTELEVFVAVNNPSGADVRRRLELYADGDLVDARELAIPAGQRSEAIVTSVPPAATVVEARLAGSDALAVDDAAFAVVPRSEPVRTLIVGEGNAYLENALALLPRLEVYAVGVQGYAQALADAEDAGTPYGLFVFDRHVPDTPPPAAAIYVGPPDDGEFGTIGEVVDGPAVGRADPAEPLLRYVDLSTVHIGRARTLTPADGVRTVLATPDGLPLVAAGTVGGRDVAVLAFALGDSDLPLQVAFPLLMSNLVDAVAPPAAGYLPPSLALGEPYALRLPASVEAATLVEGDRSTPVSLTAGRGTLPPADSVGVRQLHGGDGTVLGRTAANLFDAAESSVRPGDPARFTELGRQPSAAQAAREPSRTEWWWPLVLLALPLLVAEWLLFHRPSRRAAGRWLRGLRAAMRWPRLGRRAAAPGR